MTNARKLLVMVFILYGVGSVQAKDNYSEKHWYSDIDVDATLIFQSEEYNGVITDNGDDYKRSFLRRADVEFEKSLSESIELTSKIKSTRSGDAEISDAVARFYLPNYVNISVGRFDPEFGLELTGSSRGTIGIEKSPIYDLLLTGGDGADGVGAEVNYTTDNVHAVVSAYEIDDSVRYGGRLVISPIKGKSHRLHIGASISAASATIASDGEIKSGLGFWTVGDDSETNAIKLAKDVNSGVIKDNEESGVELLYQVDNISLQSEYVLRTYQSDAGQYDTEARGYYWQLVYTLTGEARSYKKRNATLRGVKPTKKDGALPGAWEVFYRYSGLEAEQERGNSTNEFRKSNVHVFGVNWYCKKDLRISFNYSDIHTPADDNDVGEVDGDGFALQTVFRF